MNTTEVIIDETAMIIAILTPVSGVIIALLGLLTAIVVHKTRICLSSNDDDGIVTSQTEGKCSLSDAQMFVEFAEQNGITISDPCNVKVKDVLNIINKIRPDLIGSNEYKNISDNGATMHIEELKELTSNLIHMILKSTQV